MRVAITGAAGLIGGIVQDHLESLEHEVIGIDRPLNDWLEEVPLVNHFFNYNYREKTKELRATLKDIGVMKVWLNTEHK